MIRYSVASVVQRNFEYALYFCSHPTNVTHITVYGPIASICFSAYSMTYIFLLREEDVLWRTGCCIWDSLSSDWFNFTSLWNKHQKTRSTSKEKIARTLNIETAIIEQTLQTQIRVLLRVCIVCIIRFSACFWRHSYVSKSKLNNE